MMSVRPSLRPTGRSPARTSAGTPVARGRMGGCGGRAPRAVVLAVTADAAAGLGMGDGTGELRGHRYQERHLVFGEFAALALPYHQHAQQIAMMNDRYAENTVEILFAGLGEETIKGMIGRIIE